MVQFVTIPGGNNSRISVPFTDQDAYAQALPLQAQASAAFYEQAYNVVRESQQKNGAVVPGDLNVLLADVAGATNPVAGTNVLLADLPDPNPAQSFIAQGNLDGSELITTAQSVAFYAGAGHVQVEAEGSITIAEAYAAAVGGTVVLSGGGSDMVQLAYGTWSVVTGIGGRTQVALGAGADTVVAQGQDTVRVGGGPATITAAMDHTAIYGGAGTAVVTLNGSADTVQGGTGRVTITANGTGEQIGGGGGEIVFVDRGTGSTLVGNTSGLVVYGTPHGGSLYQASSSYFYFVSQGGQDTVNVSASEQAPVVFGYNGGDVKVDAAAAGTFVACGSGSETVDLSGSSASATFFAGTGPAFLLGAPNVPNFYGANTGDATLSGGQANVYDFFSGHGGATDLITHFNGNDQLYLTSFGHGSNDGIAGSTVVNGELNLMLTDGTRIVFQNVSSFAAIAGQIHHN